jgi:hypothetical protein
MSDYQSHQAHADHIDHAVTPLCVAVAPWANEMLGLSLADTRCIVEETLSQLQQILVARSRCDIPYLGRIECHPDHGWQFEPDRYALGLLPPSCAAAQLFTE